MPPIHTSSRQPTAPVRKPTLKLRRAITLAALCAVALTSCGGASLRGSAGGGNPDDSDTTTTAPEVGPTLGLTRIWIGPDRSECMGMVPRSCFEVSESPDGANPYFLFDYEIEGFTHVEGTSYVLDVRISEVDPPPMDASSLRFKLVRIVESSP